MAQRLSKLERMRANDKSARESIGADGPRLAATPLTPIPAAKAALKTATFPVHSVPVNLVDPDPGQPRKHFDPDELAKLADTIRTSGQLQPGCAYLDPGKGRYILIFGERRLRATALAGLDRIDLKILPGVPTREEIRRIQRLENLQRVNLDPIEQALDYRRAIDEEGL